MRLLHTSDWHLGRSFHGEGLIGAQAAYVDHSPPPPPRDEFFGAFGTRERGAGRPTKRDRRELDRLRGGEPG